MHRLLYTLLWIVAASVPVRAINIELQQVATGFDAPVLVTHANDSSNRLFVVEQSGKIRIINSLGNVEPTPFLDLGPFGLGLTNRLGEQGLLGLAFPAFFDTTGRFYVSYTRASDGASIISRFRATPSSSNISGTNETIIYGPIAQPQENHNGGMIAFGPDGYLYIGIGDGGNFADEGPGHTDLIGNAQDRTNVLGDLLRIDVHTPSVFGEYSIPETNPFVENANGWMPEIYAWGFRNPWRFSFDFETDRLFLADVGQYTIEEIDLVINGGNYGWRRMEGTLCYNPGTGCQTGSLELPIFEYDHLVGCSITGGYVYRGEDYPALNGLYFYADFCQGTIWTLEETSPNAWTSVLRSNHGFNISSFGEDTSGELYVCNYDNGVIYKIIDTDPQPTATPLPNFTRSWAIYD